MSTSLQLPPIQPPHDQDIPHTHQDQTGGEQDSNNQIDQAMETDVLLKEDLIMQYLDLLIPEDRYLLNLPFIHEEGEKYIANWRETVFPEYKTQLRNLVSKYSNRRKYQIQAMKTKIAVVSVGSGAVDKDTKSTGVESAKQIASIDKPVFMELDMVLRQGRSAVQSRRSAIRMQYEHLLSKPYLDEKDKARFLKQRESFIEHLNVFYAVQYYANKINQHVTHNKDIPVPVVVDYQQQGVKNPVPRVDSIDINIDAELIEKMYEQEGAKLEMYNHILDLQAKDTPVTEINAAIKEYLQYDETNDIMKSINTQIKKLKNRQSVNWLVVATAGDRPLFCKRSVPPNASRNKSSSTKK